MTSLEGLSLKGGRERWREERIEDGKRHRVAKTATLLVSSNFPLQGSSGTTGEALKVYHSREGKKRADVGETLWLWWKGGGRLVSRGR